MRQEKKNQFRTAVYSVFNKLGLNYLSGGTIFFLAVAHAIISFINNVSNRCQDFRSLAVIGYWVLISVFILVFILSILFVLIKFLLTKNISRLFSRIAMYQIVYVVIFIVTSSILGLLHETFENEAEYKVDKIDLLVREYAEKHQAYPNSLSLLDTAHTNKTWLGLLPLFNVDYRVEYFSSSKKSYVYIEVLEKSKVVDIYQAFTPKDQTIVPGCGW